MSGIQKLPRDQIAAVIAKRSLVPADGPDLAREVAAYLLAEHRTADVESLVRDVWQYRADHGLVEVRVTSAFALSDKLRTAIKAQVQKLYPAVKQVIISEQRDPSIIGGIRLELANQQLDASLRAKLNHFKQLTAVGKD